MSECWRSTPIGISSSQGTLFGRNALAGVVQYVSARPTADFNGFGEVTFGQYDLRPVEGAVGGPLTDALGARVSVLSFDRGPDLYNDFLKVRQGDLVQKSDQIELQLYSKQGLKLCRLDTRLPASLTIMGEDSAPNVPIEVSHQSGC